MSNHDESKVQIEGTLIAMGFVMSALIRTHPSKANLLQALQEILKGEGSLYGELPAEIQIVVDQRLHELLYQN